MLARVGTLIKHGHSYNKQVLYLKLVIHILQDQDKFPVAKAHAQVLVLGININQANGILSVQSIKSNKNSIPMDQSKLVLWSTLISCLIKVVSTYTLQDL